MAYTATIACFFFLVIGATMAAEYTVGDAAGWTTGVDYQKWASKYKIQEGDTLVFKWQGKGPYRVVAATKKELDDCKLDKSNKETSPNVTEYKFQIPKSGDYFFINDLSEDSCKSGMRLHIGAGAAPTKNENRKSKSKSKSKYKSKSRKSKSRRSDAASTAALSLSTTFITTFCIGLFLASKV